jgi:RNA polymerase sigma factor (sigma-70 family)
MDDLFQVGCIGLIKAIDNFDLSHEVKFSTYAVPMILGEVKRYLRDNNSIRVARSIKDTANKVLKVKEQLTNTLEKEPNIKMIAEHYYDGPDPIGKTHVREGVVVRILNRPAFTAFKHKNFAFKCLEGIVKAEAEAPDMEEAQEV